MFIKYMLRWRLARLVRLRRERDGYERSLQDLYSEKIELLRILQQHKENQPGFFTYVFEGVKVVTGLGVAAAGVAAALVAGEALGGSIPGGAEGFVGHAVSHKVGHEVTHSAVEAGAEIVSSGKVGVFDYGSTLQALEEQLMQLERRTIKTRKQLNRIQSKISRVERRGVPQSFG